MPCGCNKGNQQVVYVYTAPNGQQVTYTTEIQAQVAKVKNGGGSYAAQPK